MAFKYYLPVGKYKKIFSSKMKKLITYNDAVDIITKKFDKSNKTMYEIEQESGVSYYILSLIKNKYKKPYPRAMVKLLKYFGISAKKVMAFEIEDSSETHLMLK